MKLLFSTLFLVLSIGLSANSELVLQTAKAINAEAFSIRASVSDSEKESAKIQAIIPGVEKVLRSPAFKERVLASTFKDTKDTSAQVYDKLIKNNWELNYAFKRNKRKVLGWTYPSTKTVWFNNRNFMSRKDDGIAGTICHEQSHKLGYGHKSAKSYQSVPYSLGTICSQMYQGVAK